MIPKWNLWGDCTTLVHTIFSMDSFVHFVNSSSHLLLKEEDHSGSVDPNGFFMILSLAFPKTFPEVQYLEGTRQCSSD